MSSRQQGPFNRAFSNCAKSMNRILRLVGLSNFKQDEVGNITMKKSTLKLVARIASLLACFFVSSVSLAQQGAFLDATKVSRKMNWLNIAYLFTYTLLDIVAIAVAYCVSEQKITKFYATFDELDKINIKYDTEYLKTEKLHIARLTYGVLFVVFSVVPLLGFSIVNYYYKLNMTSNSPLVYSLLAVMRNISSMYIQSLSVLAFMDLCVKNLMIKNRIKVLVDNIPKPKNNDELPINEDTTRNAELNRIIDNLGNHIQMSDITYNDEIENYLKSAISFILDIKIQWKNVNKMYEKQVLLFCLGLFMRIITSVYFYLNIDLMNPSNLILFITKTFYWPAFIITLIVHFMEHYSSIIASLRKMMNQVEMIYLDPTTSSRVKDEASRVLTILRRRLPPFNVCGFFDFDYAMLMEFIVAVASYTVIFIHLQA